MASSKPGVPEPTEIAGRYVIQEAGRGRLRHRLQGQGQDPRPHGRDQDHPPRGPGRGQGAGLEEMLDRFKREAQVSAQLKHPNIVTIYDIGDADGMSYLAMEFIDGVGLEKVIAQGQLAPGARGLASAAQVADALDFAHKHGVVHRDIKPANIMLEAGDRVKVTDFGIAKVTDSAEHLTMTGQPPGHAVLHEPRAGARRRRSTGAATSSRWAACSTR